VLGDQRRLPDQLDLLHHLRGRQQQIDWPAALGAGLVRVLLDDIDLIRLKGRSLLGRVTHWRSMAAQRGSTFLGRLDDVRRGGLR
jgi:hypothetical protein